MEKLGITETTEFLEGLGELAHTAKKIAEDKKISVDDLKHLLDLAKNMNVLVEGFKGVKEIPSEMKDLDQEELLAIAATVYGLVKKVS